MAIRLVASLAIIFLIVWIGAARDTLVNRAGERPGSPERQIDLPKVPHIQKSLDRWYSFYGPPPQENPICDLATLTSYPEDAHHACETECRNIAHVVHAALDHYPKSCPIQKLHRQCSGFVDGVCRQVFWSRVTWCECRGIDFSRPARFCRIMIGGTRMGANSGLILGDYLQWLVDYAAERGYLSKQESTDCSRKGKEITMMSLSPAAVAELSRD